MNIFELVHGAEVSDSEERGRIDVLVRQIEARHSCWHREEVLKRLLGAMIRLHEAEVAKRGEFFMVYRKGGRAPAFKHDAEEAAIAEAKRIARESGEATYVLAAVSKVDPHPLPTNDEFARHANAHPYGIAGSTSWGLWRVCVEGRLPTVIAVRCGDGGPYASYDSPGGSCLPSGGKWFPLDANGKDVVDEDLPL